MIQDNEGIIPSTPIAHKWQDTAAQHLIRYEALFSFLSDIQGMEIEQSAVHLARQWKYFSNVTAWRLSFIVEDECRVFDGRRGQAESRIMLPDELDEWDRFFLNSDKPELISIQDYSSQPTPPVHLAQPKAKQLQILPLHQNQNCIGVLSVSSGPDGFEELDIRFIKLLAQFYSDILYSRIIQTHAIRVLRTKATRDSLTGLLNRGAIMEQLDASLALAKREQLSICVLLVDVDHFKSINDKFGHQTGDAVLQDIARLLDETARASDRIGRYGGEEFLIILNLCQHDELDCIGERFRNAISRHRFTVPELGHIGPITISIGGACSNQASRFSAEHLIRTSDRALYKAKANGRDQVVIE